MSRENGKLTGILNNPRLQNRTVLYHFVWYYITLYSMPISKCSSNNAHIYIVAFYRTRGLRFSPVWARRGSSCVIYSVLAKYLDHQTRIPRTHLQFWHSIRGIHRWACICSDAVCDLMHLFETQSDSSSTSEEGVGEIRRTRKIKSLLHTAEVERVVFFPQDKFLGLRERTNVPRWQSPSIN